MEEIIFAGYASEEETLKTIKTVFNEYHYLVDPHTAVGVKVFRDYRNIMGEKTKTVVDATASPFKFNRSVLAALSGKEYIQNIDELYLLEELSRQTGLSVPEMLQDLGNKKIRHHLVYDKEDAQKSLQDILKIK